MRMPEMPLEPMENGRLIIGATDEVEDEDRIMELLAWVHRRTDRADPSASLRMTGMEGGAV